MSRDDYDPQPGDIRRYDRRPYGGGNFFDVMAARYASWTEQAMLDAERSVLEKRQRLLEQKVSLAVTELSGRTAVTRAFAEMEDAQAELEFFRTAREMSPADARSFIAAGTETERRLAQRSAYRTARLGGHWERFLPAADAAGQAPEVSIDVSEQEIERESLRGLARLGSLPEAMLQDELAAWEGEVRAKLPDYAAEEVVGRTAQLLSTVRVGR